MQLKEKMEVLLRLHHLIQRRATGDVHQLSRRLCVSKSTLFRYLNELRNFGAPIHFCSHRKCYYYTEAFELTIQASNNAE